MDGQAARRRRQLSAGGSYIFGRRFGGFARHANDVALLLKSQEIKSLVFNDGSADRKAEIVVAQFGLFDVGWREWRSRPVRFITVEVVG